MALVWARRARVQVPPCRRSIGRAICVNKNPRSSGHFDDRPPLPHARPRHLARPDQGCAQSSRRSRWIRVSDNPRSSIPRDTDPFWITIVTSVLHLDSYWSHQVSDFYCVSTSFEVRQTSPRVRRRHVPHLLFGVGSECRWAPQVLKELTFAGSSFGADS